MSPGFQEQFSLYKGSIPVRQNISMDKFDSCAKKSFAAEQATIKSNSFFPPLAFGDLQPSATAGAKVKWPTRPGDSGFVTTSTGEQNDV